jgi:dihydrofolate synthase/folylpolyglutamate synthase
VITIAGTNGKGSTARVTEALLLDAGYSVGTTLSPHVWRFNERIRIDGVEASDATICNAFAAIDEARDDLPLTYFEFSALAALFCMALDHQAFLGDTREVIGGEKAGILRAGQRVVLGRNMPESVYARCRILGLTPSCWGEDFSSLNRDAQWVFSRPDGEAITVPQTRLAAHNVAVACEAVADMVELNAERILRCADLAIPGRMDIREANDRVWVHDVCHNPDGGRFFMGELAARGIVPSFFICAMLAGKDHLSFYQAINDKAIGAPGWAFIDSQNDRALSGQTLADIVGLPGAGVGNMGQAIDLAQVQTGQGDVIVIFGSFSAVEQSPWLA